MPPQFISVKLSKVNHLNILYYSYEMSFIPEMFFFTKSLMLFFYSFWEFLIKIKQRTITAFNKMGIHF